MGDIFTVHWVFFLVVPVLESLRIYFLAGDIRKLAKQKGEPPLNWVLSTIGLWVLVECGVIAAWWWLNDGEWMLAAVFVAILSARLLFSILKKNLERRPDVSMEQKIDQIGGHED